MAERILNMTTMLLEGRSPRREDVLVVHNAILQVGLVSCTIFEC